MFITKAMEKFTNSATLLYVIWQPCHLEASKLLPFGFPRQNSYYYDRQKAYFPAYDSNSYSFWGGNSLTVYNENQVNYFCFSVMART